jgi:C-terminal processing protease CtpA/Prc
MFGDKVFDEFKAALTVLSQSNSIRKVVIDLRNNP